MKKTIIVVISMVISLTFVGCNSSGNKDTYNHTWDYETKEYKNMSVSELIKLRDKLIDDEYKGIEESYAKEQKKEIFGDGTHQLDGFVNNIYSNMSEKDNLIKQIKLIKYSDAFDYGINPCGEFMYRTNIDYQFSEFFTINKLWSEENKEKRHFDPDVLVDNFEKIYEYTDLSKYEVFNIIITGYCSANGKISTEKKATLLNKYVKLNDKKYDDRLMIKGNSKDSYINDLRHLKEE
ncbi:hypothetical protein, partial [Romboutsia maritimum]